MDRQPAGLLAEQWGIERPALLYVGNLQPYQGVDLLIEAYAIAVGKGSDLDLVIAGGTPRDIDKYSRKALSCGVAERTHLIGPWPNSRLSELLAEAMIIVSPRIRGINTPMKIFPYLHTGLPVLVTEIPTHTQILDSTVAFLAPPDPVSMAAAIIRLERDPELRARLGQAGQALVESNLAEVYIELERWTDAERHVSGALAIADERGDPLRRADGLKFLGMIQRAKGELSMATKTLIQSHKLAEESEDVLLAAEAARELGETHAQARQFESAREFFERANELFTETNAGLDATAVQERLEQMRSEAQ